MRKESGKRVLVFSIIGVLLVGIAISFAFWRIVLIQKNPNVVTTDCFKVTFTDGDAINIPNAYPMSDIEGMKNDSYDFTVTNICNNRVLYQINLESLIPEGKRLPERYIKANLMEENVSKVTTKLEEDLKVEPIINGADNAYKLLEGELGANASKTFHLRLWMHSEVTSHDEESMNATYVGKVSVITSYTRPLSTLVETIKNTPVVTSGDGLYEVSHEDAEITYTNDVNAQNLLKETELRYAGLTPDNYVRFNNELWRVIGLVNTPEGQRVKIIRDESIGDYSWDTSESSINNGYGVNEWSQADLKILLNEGAYYNRASGICYNGDNNATTECDFSASGLTNEAKEMIDTITWNTGSQRIDSINNIKVSDMYSFERSNNLGKACTSSDRCNDNVNRITTWKGKIGLIYPSDYGYSSANDDPLVREKCLNSDVAYFGNNSCGVNSWLTSKNRQCTLVPNASTTNADIIWYVANSGNMNGYYAYTAYDIFPTLYLNVNIKILDGNGSQEMPFVLSD